MPSLIKYLVMPTVALFVLAGCQTTDTGSETVFTPIKTASAFECSKDYDIWECRTDSNGQMEQCVVIKKSSLHGMKVYFQKT